MADGCWSCVAESAETFPLVTGEPAYSNDLATRSLPVRPEKGENLRDPDQLSGKKVGMIRLISTGSR
ncbi:hypothetical protein CHL67_05875 [Prosthecochloris sp. GSB1]|nr:hypothetical protein CHL67_05875 [Prosthecochloris sp. GSB1]